jgi:hypothetical protein
MSEQEQQGLREQIASDVREIKQAVLGDKAIGLNGLVDDMREMKTWRNSITIKAALVSGAVSSVILGGKAFLVKVFGNQWSDYHNL